MLINYTVAIWLNVVPVVIFISEIGLSLSNLSLYINIISKEKSDSNESKLYHFDKQCSLQKRKLDSIYNTLKI